LTYIFHGVRLSVADKIKNGTWFDHSHSGVCGALGSVAEHKAAMISSRAGRVNQPRMIGQEEWQYLKKPGGTHTPTIYRLLCAESQLANYKLRFSLSQFNKVPPPKDLMKESIENREQCGNSIGSNRKLCIPQK
jgi:hypothetical protein